MSTGESKLPRKALKMPWVRTHRLTEYDMEDYVRARENLLMLIVPATHTPQMLLERNHIEPNSPIGKLLDASRFNNPYEGRLLSNDTLEGLLAITRIEHRTQSVVMEESVRNAFQQVRDAIRYDDFTRSRSQVRIR